MWCAWKLHTYDRVPKADRNLGPPVGKTQVPGFSVAGCDIEGPSAIAADLDPSQGPRSLSLLVSMSSLSLFLLLSLLSLLLLFLCCCVMLGAVGVVYVFGSCS